MRHQPLFYSFWSINGPLDQVALRTQMDQFREAGLDGVVFHPRSYPGIPPYLSPRYLAELSAAISYAKSIGLRFWLYDENGFPSGTADGQLFTKFPEDVAVRLELVSVAQPDAVASFWTSENGLCDAPGDGRRQWFLRPQSLRGLDCLTPEPCLNFLGLIHEQYRTGLTPEAFDYVEAVFTDEPESGISWEPAQTVPAVPWSRQMLSTLREKFGSDVESKLPLLFFRGPGYREFRIGFWESITDQICKGFFDPYREWCERAGKLFVGHVKGEEHPLFQIPMVGSCQRVYRHLSIPGIDALERYPSNHFFPRQAFSVASQFGDGRSLVECFGGAGWGASPGDLERYLLWLGRNGMTDFVLHLSQYRLDSAAIRDWPPSQPLHLNWREAYPAVLRRVRRNLLENPLQQPDTLVIAPYRGIMAEYDPGDLLETNIHNAATYPSSEAGVINRRFMEQVQQLHDAGIGYHVTDERTFEESASTADGRTILGNCSYGKVLIADGALLNSQGLAIIEDAKTAGGQVGTIIEAVAKPLPETPVVVLAERDSVALTWKIDQHPENAFLLECRADNGGFIGEFECFIDEQSEPRGEMRILFADDAADVVVNGCEVAIQRSGEGSVACVPWSLIAERNTFHFHCPAGVERPFVWITGDFRVESQTPFETVPGVSVLRTKGPMVLCVKNDSIDTRGGLIEAGYPFLRAPLVAETSMVLTSGIVGLRFCGVSGDAAKVTLDGGDSTSGGWIEWIWGPDWAVTHAIPAGAHQLKIELIPSTYNFFGPHHYYGGDWHVLSPGQYDGIKNFADPIDAPATTHVDAWHFKPLELPSHAQALSLRNKWEGTSNAAGFMIDKIV